MTVLRDLIKSAEEFQHGTRADVQTAKLRAIEAEQAATAATQAAAEGTQAAEAATQAASENSVRLATLEDAVDVLIIDQLLGGVA